MGYHTISGLFFGTFLAGLVLCSISLSHDIAENNAPIVGAFTLKSPPAPTEL